LYVTLTEPHSIGTTAERPVGRELAPVKVRAIQKGSLKSRTDLTGKDIAT
jgi:hypothetical protein